MHVLSPVKVYSDSLHIYLALVIAPLIGVGRRGGSSSHKFPDIYHSWLSSHFFKTRCILTPWIFDCAGFSAVSDLKSLLKAPLLRFVSSINVYNVVRGGSKIVSKYF